MIVVVSLTTTCDLLASSFRSVKCGLLIDIVSDHNLLTGDVLQFTIYDTVMIWGPKLKLSYINLSIGIGK